MCGRHLNYVGNPGRDGAECVPRMTNGLATEAAFLPIKAPFLSSRITEAYLEIDFICVLAADIFPERDRKIIPGKSDGNRAIRHC